MAIHHPRAMMGNSVTSTWVGTLTPAPTRSSVSGGRQTTHMSKSWSPGAANSDGATAISTSFTSPAFRVNSAGVISNQPSLPPSTYTWNWEAWSDWLIIFRVCTSVPPGRTSKSIRPGATPTLSASAEEAASTRPITGSRTMNSLTSLPAIAHL